MAGFLLILSEWGDSNSRPSRRWAGHAASCITTFSLVNKKKEPNGRIPFDFVGVGRLELPAFPPLGVTRYQLRHTRFVFQYLALRIDTYNRLMWQQAFVRKVSTSSSFFNFLFQFYC